MNRRNFIGNLLIAGAAFTILPGAGRLWKAQVEVPLNHWFLDDNGMYHGVNILMVGKDSVGTLYEMILPGHWSTTSLPLVMVSEREYVGDDTIWNRAPVKFSSISGVIENPQSPIHFEYP